MTLPCRNTASRTSATSCPICAGVANSSRPERTMSSRSNSAVSPSCSRAPVGAFCAPSRSRSTGHPQRGGGEAQRLEDRPLPRDLEDVVAQHDLAQLEGVEGGDRGHDLVAVAEQPG